MAVTSITVGACGKPSDPSLCSFISSLLAVTMAKSSDVVATSAMAPAVTSGLFKVAGDVIAGTCGAFEETGKKFDGVSRWFVGDVGGTSVRYVKGPFGYAAEQPSHLQSDPFKQFSTCRICVP